MALEEAPARRSIRSQVFEAMKTLDSSPESSDAAPPAPPLAEAPQPAAPPESVSRAPKGVERLSEAGDSDTQPPINRLPAADAPPPPERSNAPAAADAPPPPAAAAAAAPAPVEASPSPSFDDYEPVEYDDDDLGEKVTVLAPKTKAQQVRNGYATRSIMSRHATYLQRHKDFLAPMIASGQFDAVRPFLEGVMTNPEFARVINDAALKFQRGEYWQQAQPAPQQQQQASADDEFLIDPEQYDPYTAEAVTAAVKPLMQRVSATQRELETLRATEAQRQQMIQAQTTGMQRAQRASRELALRFPGEFSGDLGQDEQKMLRLHHYADRSGWFQQYGYDAAPMLYTMAKMELDQQRSGVAPLGAPAAAQGTTAAPVAQSTLAQVQQEALARGNEIARRVGGVVASGSSSMPPPAPPVDPLSQISSKSPDGSPRKIKDVARDVVVAMEKSAWTR